ncbi:MAG TPA: hypothetical protein H9980_06180 [Candidatus Erysipelatoclostridium merdavium]|uniref:Aldo/keto reductase n=1 Tax=Candidatus Erysipelatoclostridium merdavium TaxID=2838566 RepID=A0A9D1XLA1_9FIRM|nr:hypothetical protein [Candidatus Erysipelatoclostridium merdavium]
MTRSHNLKRIKENIGIFDFKLTDQEMEAINSLDRIDGNTFDNRDLEVVKRICLNRDHY